MKSAQRTAGKDPTAPYSAFELSAFAQISFAALPLCPCSAPTSALPSLLPPPSPMVHGGDLLTRGVGGTIFSPTIFTPPWNLLPYNLHSLRAEPGIRWGGVGTIDGPKEMAAPIPGSQGSNCSATKEMTCRWTGQGLIFSVRLSCSDPWPPRQQPKRWQVGRLHRVDRLFGPRGRTWSPEGSAPSTGRQAWHPNSGWLCGTRTQPMRQTWTILHPHGPNHLGLHATWTVIQRCGPDHLGVGLNSPDHLVRYLAGDLAKAEAAQDACFPGMSARDKRAGTFPVDAVVREMERQVPFQSSD